MQRKLSAYSIILIYLLNIASAYVRLAITGASFISASVFAQQIQSDTPLLDDLKEKYDLDNPNRNHSKGGLREGVSQHMNRASRDMTPVLMQQINTAPQTRQVDISNQGSGKSQSQMVSDSNAIGKSIGLKAGQPVLNSSGGVKAEYSKEGTREFYRDTDGKLKIRTKAGGGRVSNLGSEDLYSSEKDNVQYDFRADDMHGDDVALKNDGLRTHQALKSGTTGAARGYQVLASGAQQSINTGIDEKAPWLQPGFNALESAQDNQGDFFKSCTNVSVTKPQNVTYSSSTEHICMDTGQANFDQCAVERVIRAPIIAEGTQLQSCGPGCYEYLMTVGTWKSSRCRITGDDGGPAAKLAMTINFNDSAKIKRVTLKGTAEDHFSFKLNGDPLWESNGGSQGTSGNLYAGSCNPDGNHKINTDVTTRFKNIIGTESNVASVVLTGDLRWKRSGWLEVMFRIEFDDTSGKGFVSEFNQYPAGCYDALSYEDKRTKGLGGIYDWKEIGVSYTTGGTQFSCERQASTPTCNAGETLFGTATQEQCLSTPNHVPPSCSIGVYDEVTKACYHDATLKNKVQPTDPDVYHCPTAGTLVVQKCKTPATFTPSCQPTRNLAMVTVKGVEGEYCSGSPTGLTTYPWSCGGGNTFGSGSCSISYENYEDVDGSLIKTYTNDGFQINPVYDKDGERAEFSDSATCSIGGSDTYTPKPEKTSFCTFESYKNINVGDGGFSPSFLAMIPAWYGGDTGNKTWRVNLEGYKCDPTKGQIMCHMNPATGENECTDWKTVQDQSPRCEPYLNDPQCREVNRSCPDGWKEEITGRCMSEQVTFRCDKGGSTQINITETKNVCDAAIPCADGDCVDNPTEDNKKFVEAMVAGSIMDGLQNDASCEDPSDPSTCRVFEGEYKYCSWETTGLGTDCCEQPKGLDILAYVSMARQMMKVTQMAGSGAFGQTAQGTYNVLSEPITNASQAVSSWANSAFKSTTESLFGNSTGQTAGAVVGPEAGETAIGAALAELQQQVYQFVYDMMPDSLANLIFTTSASQGGNLVINEALSNAFSNVMAIYTAYQMVKLALTLLTSCDDIELDMGVKLAQRSCFKVGEDYCAKRYPVVGACMQKRQDYCCYSSILSRIIMKDAYGQLNINPVQSDRDASCRGLTTEQLSQVDFGAPSMQNALQEWIGLLAESGEIPTSTNEMSLTGDAQKTQQSCQEVEEVVVNPITGQPERNPDGSVKYQKTGEMECWDRVSGGQIWNPGNRDPAGQRTKDMTKNADDRVQEAKDRMKDAANSLDCSRTPRPPVCEFGFDPRSVGN